MVRCSIVSLKYGLLCRSSCCWTHYTTCLSQLHCCQCHNDSSGDKHDLYSDVCFTDHRADNSLRMIVNDRGNHHLKKKLLSHFSSFFKKNYLWISNMYSVHVYENFHTYICSYIVIHICTYGNKKYCFLK